MKKFVTMHLVAAAAEAGSTAPVADVAPVAPAPTSEKLTEIDGRLEEAYTRLDAAVGNRGEQNTINMEIFKINQERAAELVAIKKHEAELALQEKRNERVALVDKLLAAHDANNATQADKKASIEDKNLVYDALKTAKEKVVNELLAKYPANKPAATSTGTPAATGTKGGVSAEIHAILTAELASGQSLSNAKKAAVDKGYSRGTVGSVATQMVKNNEATN